MGLCDQSLMFCVLLVPPLPSQGKWPEQQEESFHTPARVLAEPTWICPHRQGGILILEGATSQHSGHFLDQIVLLFLSPPPNCFDRCLAGSGKPSGLVLAPSSSQHLVLGISEDGTLKSPPLKWMLLLIICPAVVASRVCHLSHNVTLFPPTSSPLCECGRVRHWWQQWPEQWQLLLVPFTCQHKAMAFSLVPGEAHATGTSPQPGDTRFCLCRQAWSILGTLRTKDWGSV